MQAAQDHYKSALADKDPAVKVAATARMSQLAYRISSLLARAEIPLDVRTGDFAADKKAAYCDQLAELAEPLLSSAEHAAQACRSLADASKLAPGWWDAVCRR
jgi:hypothetical protein